MHPYVHPTLLIFHTRIPCPYSYINIHIKTLAANVCFKKIKIKLLRQKKIEHPYLTHCFSVSGKGHQVFTASSADISKFRFFLFHLQSTCFCPLYPFRWKS